MRARGHVTESHRGGQEHLVIKENEIGSMRTQRIFMHNTRRSVCNAKRRMINMKETVRRKLNGRSTLNGYGCRNTKKNRHQHCALPVAGHVAGCSELFVAGETAVWLAAQPHAQAGQGATKKGGAGPETR